VHAADLEIAGDDLEVVEDAPQVVLLQLQTGSRGQASVIARLECFRYEVMQVPLTGQHHSSVRLWKPYSA